MAFRSAQTCAVRVRVHGRLDFPYKDRFRFLVRGNGVMDGFCERSRLILRCVLVWQFIMTDIIYTSGLFPASSQRQKWGTSEGTTPYQ